MRGRLTCLRGPEVCSILLHQRSSTGTELNSQASRLTHGEEPRPAVELAWGPSVAMLRTTRFGVAAGRMMRTPPSVSTRAFTELPVVDVSALRRPHASLVKTPILPLVRGLQRGAAEGECAGVWPGGAAGGGRRASRRMPRRRLLLRQASRCTPLPTLEGTGALSLAERASWTHHRRADLSMNTCTGQRGFVPLWRRTSALKPC